MFLKQNLWFISSMVCGVGLSQIKRRWLHVSSLLSRIPISQNMFGDNVMWLNTECNAKKKKQNNKAEYSAHKKKKTFPAIMNVFSFVNCNCTNTFCQFCQQMDLKTWIVLIWICVWENSAFFQTEKRWMYFIWLWRDYTVRWHHLCYNSGCL